MSKLLWNLLQSIFVCGIDEESEEVESEEQETEEEETEEEESESESETETESQETHSGRTESRAQREIRTLRERAQKAEDDARKAREEIAAARQQANPNAQKTEDQKLWEDEEKILNDPNADSWQRYAIQSNRNARAAEANSRRALQEAHDLKDQAEFDRVAASNPKAASRYKDQVEEMKRKNPGAPRSKILAMLLGEDILNGKFKAETTKSTKSSGGANRGKLPGARSDAQSSGRQPADSEAAIEKRLSGVRI